MIRAAFADSTSVPEPPSIESCNPVLDPDGWSVEDRLGEIYTTGQIENFQTVFTIRNLIADEVERLVNILDRLDGDHDLEFNIRHQYNDPRLDDAEGDSADDEPSLAGFDGMPVGYRQDDLELDHAESGIGDLDGLQEQLGRVA